MRGNLSLVACTMSRPHVIVLVMDLTRWIADGPRGRQASLVRASGVSHETIRKLLRGQRLRNREVARRIHKATGGDVPMSALLDSSDA